MASYARMADRFGQAGAGLAGISVDEPEKNRAMVLKLLLPFPLLSDPEAAVIRRWEVWNPDESVAKPAIFLVRPDRSIAFSYVGTDFADRPSDEELLAALGQGARA